MYCLNCHAKEVGKKCGCIAYCFCTGCICVYINKKKRLTRNSQGLISNKLVHYIVFIYLFILKFSCRYIPTYCQLHSCLSFDYSTIQFINILLKIWELHCFDGTSFSNIYFSLTAIKMSLPYTATAKNTNILKNTSLECDSGPWE